MQAKKYHFPFEELPELGALPVQTFQAAVNEATAANQTPLKMGHYCALGAISMVAQCLINIEKPSGGNVGPSNYILIVGKSGERKTTLDKVFFKPVMDLQRSLNASSESIELRREKWEIKKRVLAAKYKKAFKSGSDLEKAEADLNSHVANAPIDITLIYENTTIEGLMGGLKDFPNGVILSSDSEKVFKQVILRHGSDVNKVWSDEPLPVKRKTTISFILEDARLTISISIQPDPLNDIMEGEGQSGINNGLFSRFVICNVGEDSTQGTRFIGIPGLPGRHVEAFQQRLRHLLLRHIEAPTNLKTARKTLRFSAEAAGVWLMYYNYVEGEKNKGGRYENHDGHSSKLADVAARIAGALQLLESDEDEISLASLLSAIRLCDESSKDYVKVIAKDKDVAEAMDLYKWMLKKQREGAASGRINRNLDATYVRQYGLNRMRSKQVLDKYLLILETKGLIKYNPRGGANLRGTITLLSDGAASRVF